MPQKPPIKQLDPKATSVDILNGLRNELGGEYAERVPLAEPNMESVRAIGQIITTYEPLKNAFIDALVNRIGMVIITSRLYQNPWNRFKKGMLTLGETVEEIFVSMAKGTWFRPDRTEETFFKRDIPDVKAVFHTMNFQVHYDIDVSNDQLRQAFLSWQGITDLIAKIIESVYTGANYDEFLIMKYMICRAILNGYFYPITIPNPTADNSKSIVTTIKSISNQLEFMSTNYNPMGVSTYTDKRYQILIMSAAFDAVVDVEVLASAFNLDYVQFMGNRVLVDDFTNLDNDRLTELFKYCPDPTRYVPLTQDEINLVKTVPAILVDVNWFMIFENYRNMTQQYFGNSLYWKYWYHIWQTYSFSPFANALAFTSTTASVTSVTITPATATIAKGASALFSADVTGTGLLDKKVTWSVTGGASANTQISSDGKLTVGSDETATSLTVTATSKQDTTKTGTAAVTVSA